MLQQKNIAFCLSPLDKAAELRQFDFDGSRLQAGARSARASAILKNS